MAHETHLEGIGKVETAVGFRGDNWLDNPNCEGPAHNKFLEHINEIYHMN